MWLDNKIIRSIICPMFVCWGVSRTFLEGNHNNLNTVCVVNASLFHTSSPWHCTSTSRTLVHPTPAVEERATAGQGDCSSLLWRDEHHTHTHIHTDARTHKQRYTHTYTQKLSVKPIPPNGRSFILLTGAQGGNEVCHLYIHDPWLTPLTHHLPLHDLAMAPY